MLATARNGRFPASLLAYLPWPEADRLRLRPDAAAAAGRPRDARKEPLT